MTQIPATPRIRIAARFPGLLTGEFARRTALGAIFGVALVFHLWGIRRDLPYMTEDPTLIINPALRIASSGDLNPRRFVHPGSTSIYPLALVYHLWNAGMHGGRWWQPDPRLQTTFGTHAAEFVLLGRLLTVAYALLTLPLIYKIGQACFGEWPAVAGTLLAALHPSEIFNKQVRTDSASQFFAMLALWCCLRLYDRPTMRNQVLTGVVIGLAIGTKYYLGALVAVLIIVDGHILRQDSTQHPATARGWLMIAAGLLAVPLAFASSTPYLFLDYARAFKSLRFAFEASHFGADGLPPPQNFWWYLRTGIPHTIAWPATIAAVVGIALVIRRRRPGPTLLLVFALTFLITISLNPLHWGRWLVPILPLLALFAAHAVWSLADNLPIVRYAAIVCAIVLLAWSPTKRLVQMDRLHASPSTSVLARQWMTENLPVGSRIAFEWETLPPPLQADPTRPAVWVTRDGGRNFTEHSMSVLAVKGTIGWYAQRMIRYLVTSSVYYANYSAAPDRYPKEAAFYRQLLTQGRLVYQVSPSAEHEGPEIRIYDIQ
jgi:hypothetical protein